jgi:4-diphosphocytidyl-2-C-methyl-D-erythritol kinase
VTPSPHLKSRYTCPAKINIGLEVLFKRADGYHELNTIFARVMSPSDSIEVEPAGRFTLTCSDASLDTGEANLIYKAVKAYAAATSRKEFPPLHLHLEKQIPTGAGLGGGSSDAAQALLICNDFYGQPLPNEELREIAGWVGADVPFFVSGYKAAIGRGIGEKLEEVTLLSSSGVLIVKPEAISIATGEAYSRLQVKRRPAKDLDDLAHGNRWSEISNDFEQAIFPDNPELARIKDHMLYSGAYFASMSGSGSAIFGLFDNEQHAKNAAATFADTSTPYWVSVLP